MRKLVIFSLVFVLALSFAYAQCPGGWVWEGSGDCGVYTVPFCESGGPGGRHEFYGDSRDYGFPSLDVWPSHTQNCNEATICDDQLDYDCIPTCAARVGQTCPGGDNPVPPCTRVNWYLDSDGDGYGDPGNSVSRCSNPGGRVRNNNDCNDNDPNINPGVYESLFDMCTDNADNDCDGDIDELDLGCQVDCPSGFIEWTRYNDTDLRFSHVMDPRDSQEYEFYFPLCLEATGLDDQCGSDTIDVLQFNPSTNLVAKPETDESGYTETLCLNAQNCFLTQGACGPDHGAIAKLNSTENATLVHPSNPAPGYTLCCTLDFRGVQFANPTVEEARFPCSVVEDGICPEDFEDPSGVQISCGEITDPDCGAINQFYASDLSKVFDVFTSFDERNYLLSAENNESARWSTRDEVDTGSSYTYDFVIVSETDSDLSSSVLTFSYSNVEPTVVMDSTPISECSPVPTTVAELPLPGCYTWNAVISELTLYHTLSDHEVEVTFDYRTIPIIALILIIFILIIPIMVIKKHHLLHRFKSSKDEKVDDHIEELGRREKELENYIRKALKMGHPKSKIYGALMASGWTKHDVHNMFKKLK